MACPARTPAPRALRHSPGRALPRRRTGWPRSPAARAQARIDELAELDDAKLKDLLDFILSPPEEPVLERDEQDVVELAMEFDREPYVRIRPGPLGHPIVHLRQENGSEAVVHLHGGTVSSWTDSNSREMLFLHPRTEFDPRDPIWGGLQLAFPKHDRGLLTQPEMRDVPSGGILSNYHFSIFETHLTEDGETICPGVTLAAHSCPESHAMFPHDWQVTYHIDLVEGDPGEAGVPAPPGGVPDVPVDDEDDPAAEEPSAGRPRSRSGSKAYSLHKTAASRELEDAGADDEHEEEEQEPPTCELRIRFGVINTGKTAFKFQASTVADFAVRDLERHPNVVRVRGLEDSHVITLSKAVEPALGFNSDHEFGPYDPDGKRMHLVFPEASNKHMLLCPGNLEHYSFGWGEGWTDAVLANPGMNNDDAASGFVSVGAGCIANPVELKPGDMWRSQFTFRKHYTHWPGGDTQVDGGEDIVVSPDVPVPGVKGDGDGLYTTM